MGKKTINSFLKAITIKLLIDSETYSIVGCSNRDTSLHHLCIMTLTSTYDDSKMMLFELK